MSRTRSRHTSSYPPGARTIHYGSIDLGEKMTDELGLKNANHRCSYSRADITSSAGCLTWRRIPTNTSGVDFPDPYSTWKQGAGRECYSSPYCLRASIPTIDSGDVLSQMANDLYSKIQESGRSSVHAISFLREMTATISMLRNPFKTISFVQKWASSRSKRRSLKDAFRSAHFRSVKAHNKSLTTKEVATIASDTFLESMYGWNPFVHDVQEIARLAGGALNMREQLRAEGDKKFRLMRTGSQVVDIGDAGYTRNYPQKVVGGKAGCSWRFVYYGTLNVNPSAKAEGALASIARALNLDRLGYAMWDAVPYSFVIDWFLPLGDTLDRQLSGPAFYIMANTPWVSARTDQFFNVIISGNPDYWSPYDVKHGGGASYGERVRTFNRYPSDIDALMSQNLSNGMHGMRTVAGVCLTWGRLERLHR